MNVAIIGCNGMGAMHAQLAANCGLNIAVCGDIHLEIAQRLAKAHGAEATADCLAAVQRDDVDIVGIMTPTPTHAGYVSAAAAAGKHIFCEKPFGRTVAECKQALAAVKKAKVKLLVGHVLRYFQEFEAIRQQIEAGQVGRVGFVKMYRGGIFPMGADEWFRNYDMSGGVTLDSSIHDMDWLRYVFGDAERVFCQNIERDTPDKMDYAMATFRMKNGVIATVIGTWAHPEGFRVRTEVCGDKGMIQFNSEEAPITTMLRRQPGEGPTMIVPGSPVPVSPYQLEWEELVAWINDDAPPRVQPEDALAAVRMALAALESAETKKPVKL